MALWISRTTWLAAVPLLIAVGCVPASPTTSAVVVTPKPVKPPATTAATQATKVLIPPADPLPEQPPVTESITWERLDIGMEPDSVYQPWMLTTSIKVLEGKPVRIKGFMHGAVFQRSNIRTFHLMREKECPFGPGGQAHHAIEVELQGKLRTDFTTEELTVEGIFSVVPVKGDNGNTWSLYRIAGTSVK